MSVRTRAAAGHVCTVCEEWVLHISTEKLQSLCGKKSYIRFEEELRFLCYKFSVKLGSQTPHDASSSSIASCCPPTSSPSSGCISSLSSIASRRSCSAFSSVIVAVSSSRLLTTSLNAVCRAVHVEVYLSCSASSSCSSFCSRVMLLINTALVQDQ